MPLHQLAVRGHLPTPHPSQNLTLVA